MRFVPVVASVVAVAAAGWLSADAVFNVRTVQVSGPPGERPEERAAALHRGFADAAQDPHPDPTVSEFLEQLRVAAAAGDAMTVTDLFDAPRLSGAVFDADILPRPNAAAAGGAVEATAAVRDAVRTGVASGRIGRGWWAIRVRRVEPLPGGSEVVVYARHATAAGPVPVRWWLVKRGGDWKAYDLEDARVGLRLSHQIAGVYAAGTDPNGLERGLSALAEASWRLAEGDAKGAGEAIRPARTAPLPAAHRAVLALTEAAVALALGDPKEALAQARAADQLRPGVPGTDLVRAAALYRLGRWSDAVTHARHFTDRLGPDPQASLILARSLLGLGQAGEAVAVLRAAVTEFPGDERLAAALNSATSR